MSSTENREAILKWTKIQAINQNGYTSWRTLVVKTDNLLGYIQTDALLSLQSSKDNFPMKWYLSCTIK
jgi:hypothetical protein